MKLRRQLVLVSLLTLCLPWAGCQYLREMESALREGQGRALLATAEAVANRIASEPLLVAELTRNAAQGASERQFYVHSLEGPLLVDGYDEDWQHFPFTTHHWRQGDKTLDVRTARFQRQLYLLVHITAPKVSYYQPGQARLADTDSLRLRSLDRDGRLRDFALVASAPGPISAYDVFQPRHPLIEEESEPSAPRQYRQEHAIKGVWQETRNGYQLEIQLPWYLTQGYLGIAAVAPGPNEGWWLGSLEPDSAPAPLAHRSDTLDQAIKIFANDGLRLRVASSNQWLLAEAGNVLRELPANHGWQTHLLRRLIFHNNYPPLDTPERDGRLSGDPITQSLRGQPAQGWYHYQAYQLARAAVPIVVNGQTLGAVIAEQTSDQLSALTETALQRLVFYTFLASLLASLGLLAYASWLSLRIRRLSRAVDSALQQDKTPETTFMPSNASDELGDLSRSYHRLLTRVQEYTDYLRSLSSKLSHELRTPLAVVRSSLDNLEGEALAAGARTYAIRAQEGTQRLSAILNAMSAASRVEESIRQAEMTWFSLSRLVQDLSLAYQDIAPQNVLCELGVHNDQLYGAPDLIVQMIDKLFDNACDFCPPHGKILLTLHRHKQGLLLAVSNDGPLLPQTMQHQLFDSLVSIRETTHQESGKIHLGLGLHIVRLIAELHQAQVTARNRSDGKGVVFEILFHQQQ